MNILIVEDEPKVALFIKSGLDDLGFITHICYDGRSGREKALNTDPDLVILDVIIPHISGMELCRIIKHAKPELPVLMLTALGTTEDKLTGFDAGADDYLVKPFEFAELVARIKALTKRNSIPAKTISKLKVGDLELDLDKKIAIRNGEEIQLTAKEFNLLEFFMRNKGRVLSRSEISEQVWDIDFDTETNVVDVYVNILRKKIDKNFADKLIHTRIGMGYMFRES